MTAEGFLHEADDAVGLLGVGDTGLIGRGPDEGTRLLLIEHLGEEGLEIELVVELAIECGSKS